MTTLSTLKKHASQDLTPLMQANDFELLNTFGYAKKGPQEIWYLLHAEITHGKKLKVVAACHTEEMQELIAQRFPKFYSEMVAGRLKPGAEICYENRYLWNVESEDDIDDVLDELKSCIVAYALPFFDAMITREALVDFIYPSMMTDDYKRIAKNILAWQPDS